MQGGGGGGGCGGREATTGCRVLAYFHVHTGAAGPTNPRRMGDSSSAPRRRTAAQYTKAPRARRLIQHKCCTTSGNVSLPPNCCDICMKIQYKALLRWLARKTFPMMLLNTLA